ncbi:MAG: TonB-dependent receptor [Candidatus Kapabacteria bacterium]|nr:TonB-dependent receptor [Candidatus Kapabacteria bacterium]
MCTICTQASVGGNSISGSVRDIRLQPIARATVRVVGGSRGTITDVRGGFHLLDIIGDTVSLAVSCVGYATRTVVLVNADSISVVSITLEESSVLSRGIDVTSYRANEQDPITQTTVDRNAIDRVYAGQDPQYILERTVPSVVSYSESGTSVSNYGTFRLRGMDQTRVNVTVDGTPLNDMIDQGVFFSNMGDLTNGMRAIQVQRGTGMSTNGTASYAGSVNFEGASLSSTEPSADMQLSAGSFGLLRASATAATGRMNTDISVYARFTTLRTNGYRDHTGTVANSLYASAAWFGTTDVVRLTALWGSTQNELGYLPVPKPLADIDPKRNLNDSSDVDDFGQQLLQLQHSHAFSESAILTSTLYYGAAGGDYFTGFRDSSDLLTQTNYPLQNRHVGIMSTLEAHDVVRGCDVSLGLHAYTFRRRNSEYISPESQRPYYDDRTTKDEISGFARGRYCIGNLEAFADVQVRSVTMSFTPDERYVPLEQSIPIHRWLFVNPRIGLRYVVSEGADVYASFGRSGREPTRFDLLGSTQINNANIAVLQNPGTVKAEFVNDLELGWRLQAPYGYLKVTGFLMMFTNEIAPIGTYIEQQFVQLRKNMPSSTRMGLELEGTVRILGNLSLDLSATLMKATIDEYAPENTGVDTIYRNVKPVLSPELQLLSTLRFQPIPTISLEAAVRHIAQSYTDLTNAPSLILPSFTSVDARVWWNFFARHRVGIMANNIFNAFVVTNGGAAPYNSATVSTYFVQATRNFSVMLDIRL